VIGEDGRGGLHHDLGGVDQQPGDPRDIGFADAFAGSFRVDGVDAAGLSGCAEQHFPAEREAHGADPVGVHLGSVLEVGGACPQVFIACPAHGVAVASALAARIEQWQPEPAREEHACLVSATGAREEQDRRPVSGQDVAGRQLQAVVGQWGDGLVGNAPVGHCRLRCGVGVDVPETGPRAAESGPAR
jgi:hypothetical protein